MPYDPFTSKVDVGSYAQGRFSKTPYAFIPDNVPEISAHTRPSYGTIQYPKTGTSLGELENVLGHEETHQALRKIPKSTIEAIPNYVPSSFKDWIIGLDPSDRLKAAFIGSNREGDWQYELPAYIATSDVKHMPIDSGLSERYMQTLLGNLPPLERDTIRRIHLAHDKKK